MCKPQRMNKNYHQKVESMCLHQKWREETPDTDSHRNNLPQDP